MLLQGNPLESERSSQHSALSIQWVEVRIRVKKKRAKETAPCGAPWMDVCPIVFLPKCRVVSVKCVAMMRDVERQHTSANYGAGLICTFLILRNKSQQQTKYEKDNTNLLR
jgi:hypothetical protein